MHVAAKALNPARRCRTNPIALTLLANRYGGNSGSATKYEPILTIGKISDTASVPGLNDIQNIGVTIGVPIHSTLIVIVFDNEEEMAQGKAWTLQRWMSQTF